MKEYSLKNPFKDPASVRENIDPASDDAAFASGASVPKPASLLGGPEPAAEPARRTLTVSQLAKRIEECIEQNFGGGVWVEGELSDPKIYPSGHLWFSLKDAHSSIKAVMWAGDVQRLKFNPEHGLSVVCQGKADFHAQRGEIKFVVRSIEPKGVGALQLAFQQLTEKLQKEGLFSEERKRPLPFFPERIGLVTSPRGAAIDDMLKVLDGRLQVTLFPTRVQGDGAPEAIVRGIEMLNQREDLDLLIVGRGGGSLEDLWCFNDEEVARAIFKSRLPVISAVGHEKDVSIADLTADCRAATPTKAAELVIAQRAQAFSRLDAVLQEPAFTEPEEWVAELKERVEEIQEQLVEGLWDPILQTANRLGLLHSDLLGCSPQAVILQQAERLHGLQQSLESGMARSLESTAARFMRLTSQLNALSPLAVLERGYSITFDAHGKIIKKADAVKPGDLIQTRLHKGRLTSRVEKRED